MKSEFRQEHFKLREAFDRVTVDLGKEAGKVVKKRRVFTYFLLYRISATLIMPLVMGAYLIIGRYVDTGLLDISLVSSELAFVSALKSIIIIIIFSRKTYSLRLLIDCIVDNREYSEQQIVDAYTASFKIPVYVTIWEFILSAVFVLIPAVIISVMDLNPFPASFKEILISWWLGTLTLGLISFMFYQSWVESTLTRLYDYGIRISSDSGIKRNASIYFRISLFIGSIIITMIILYANMLYMLASKIPGQTSQYMIQVAFMSVIILTGIFFIFQMLLSSIKKSFNLLQYKMKLVQSGDYSVRFLNNRDDQIGQLYDNFDYLVSTLNNVLSSLENEVNKRTAKLQEVTSKISKYVSPQLYSKIYSEESSPSLTYTRKKLTVFFSDIAGFTSTSENLAPEDLSRILNQYLDAMAGVALKWGGTIDKYIGDAIMIFFGDPEFTDDKDHAVRCVSMAKEMLGRLEKLQEQWKSGGITFPLHVRIGINTGYCTVGNFGSESRMDYTVIGSAVNLASRLENAAPVDGILISETTYLLVNDSFTCVPAGEIPLKGIERPVKTWSISITDEKPAKSEIHIPGLDLRINRSGMTDELRDEVRRLLKETYESLG